MPQKCCVPGCQSNYYQGGYTTVFSFPKDIELKQKWVRCINRADFAPTKNAVVCILHFDQQYIIREDKLTRANGEVVLVPRQKLKLTPDAYPSIFPNLPSYLSSKPVRKRKSPEERAKEYEVREEEAFKQWVINDTILAFSDFSANFKKKMRASDDWMIHCDPDFVLLLKLDVSSCPEILMSCKISSDLTVNIWYKGVLVDSKHFSCILGEDNKCDKWSKFEALLSNCKNYTEKVDIPPEVKVSIISKLIEQLSKDIGDANEKDLKLKLISEQLQLLFLKVPRYSPNMLLWACKLYYSSPSSYNAIRQLLTLPAPTYIKRLASSYELKNCEIENKHVKYLAEKAKILSNEERVINVLMDEIYVSSGISYKGGNLLGSSRNTDATATTVQAFMLTSLISKNKDIVSLIPVKNMTAQQLKGYTLDILKMLNNCGYRVLTIISDNNSMNRNMFTMLCDGTLTWSIENPANREQTIFLLFDTVHLLKSMRNNWFNQKETNQTFFFPSMSGSEELKPASMVHLKDIYYKELHDVVKQAPKLSRKSLFPTSVERQNVKLALNIFDETNAVALEMFSKTMSKDFLSTKEFIEIIIKWWKVVNVKHPMKGRNKRDSYCDPIRCADDGNLSFLSNFSEWLTKWKHLSHERQIGKGCLSNETYVALKHTTMAFVLLCNYIFENFKMQYILLGKFQTDSLEARFGQYRQLCGANYHVSVRDILESERKLKVLSLLNLSSSQMGSFEIREFSSACQESDTDLSDIPDAFNDVSCCADNVPVSQGTLPVLIYIAGYVAHCVNKHSNCKQCCTFLATKKHLECEFPEDSEYLQLMNRGGLLWPQEFTVNVVMNTYQIFSSLISKNFESLFLAQIHHRIIVETLTLEKIMLTEGSRNACAICGTTVLGVTKKCIRVIANILLNNYSKMKTDAASFSKKPNRKVKSFH